MKSKDLISQEYRDKLTAAMQSDKPEDFANAFAEVAMRIQDEVLNEVNAYQESHDKSILAARGVKQLTSEEEKFYDCMMKAVELGDVKQAFGDLSPAYPRSTMDRVLEDIRSEFPLLEQIDVQNAETMTRVIFNKTGVQYATWNALNSAITTELQGSIGYLDITVCKLTAYLPVSKDMLKVGPAWVDAYVRAVLVEAVGAALCKAVIAGTGKGEPIGMIKDVSDSASVVSGKQPDKAAVTVTTLDPETIGSIAATLATGIEDRSRAVPEMLMVVNSVDYFKKIFPATTFLSDTGVYVHDVLPYPTKIIKDENVPKDKAIFGLGKKYFLGVGVGGSGGQIEFDDSCKFLEDLRVYVTRVYANGRPMDNNAFVVADISKLKPMKEEIPLPAQA